MTGKFNSITNLHNNDLQSSCPTNVFNSGAKNAVENQSQPSQHFVARETPQQKSAKRVWMDYKVAIKANHHDSSSELTASSYESSLSVERRVERAASIVSQQYLENVEQKVLALSAKPIEPRYTKQAQEEINQRQGVRLNVIKQ